MTYTAEQARAEIEKLVATFKASELPLMAQAEAQIENNFVRPLFECLNWNTRNAGLAVPDYEFLVQKTQRYGKRPDYVLQLDGQHLLVMDAKQVKYDMHDPRWMNQVYAYAYSTQSLSPARKIDFAVLTDFQEFVVLDCTLLAGNPKAVGNLRVLDWRCQDYVDQFDTLWDLFERENMRRHARTRGSASPTGLWARYLSPKKVDANRIPPDKAFLAEMDDDRSGWRVLLAKDMKKRNPQADGALITAAVQLLIDRLIFVKVLSDREIEEDYLTQLAEIMERDGVAESDTGWFSACRGIFDKLNQFYDGSVFEPRPELEAVTVSNKVVRDVLRELQPENSPYNFSVLPVETLGTIYERFLGRVVRTTDQRVKIEDKPEVRKAGGVYYTPQYIVEYIVRHTVGKLLEQCATPEDVARLKILDPACGSGSFLLGAYQALIDWHLHYYSDRRRLTARDRSAAYHDSDGRVRLTARLKRQILLNNLYGVDIDAQAVEVTRFSLSLKALEDTRAEELTEERDLFQQSVLPDLSANIQCGNSLIGPDYFSGQMFADPAELKLVNPFNWTQRFPEVMASGGFDAVIGNPPWGADFSENEKRYLDGHYYLNSGKYESYVFFVERATALVRGEGLFGFVIPSYWASRSQTEALRVHLAEHMTPLAFVVWPENVFEGVKMDACIVVARNAPAASHPTDIIAVGEVPASQLSQITQIGIQHFLNPVPVERWLRQSTIRFNPRIVPEDMVIYDKIASHSVCLGTLVRISQGLTLYRRSTLAEMYGKAKAEEIVEKRLFHANYRKDETFKKELLGRDVSRFFVRWNGESWVSYGPWLAHAVDERFFHGPRLVVQKIRNPSLGQRLVVGYLDDDETYSAGVLLNMIPASTDYALFFVLGLLNSKLINWWYRKSVIDVSIRVVDLQNVPICIIDFSDLGDKARHDRMVALVESMLALHKHKAAAKTQAEQELYQRQIEETDRQIDALVYELYGLTQEEIEIVEGR